MPSAKVECIDLEVDSTLQAFCGATHARHGVADVTLMREIVSRRVMHERGYEPLLRVFEISIPAHLIGRPPMIVVIPTRKHVARTVEISVQAP